MRSYHVFDTGEDIKMKRKTIALILAASTALAFTACNSSAEETVIETVEETQSTAEETASEASAGMANPWVDVSTMDEAAEGAGIDSLILTEDGTDTASGLLSWYGYRYTDGIAEIYGAIGTADITVRKGFASLGDISGDYNAYTYNWELEVDDITVNCSGNEEGQAMLLTWTVGDYNYVVMVRGQGDLYDTYGISSDTISPLVSEWIS